MLWPTRIRLDSTRGEVAGVPDALTKKPVLRPPDEALFARRVKRSTATESPTLAQIEAGLPIHRAIDGLVSLVHTGALSPAEALMKVDPSQVESMNLAVFDDAGQMDPIGRGLGVSTGCATGVAVFDPAEAKRRADAGEDVILVVTEVLPEEVEALKAVRGVICSRGDETSHTSVVAREYGTPGVLGDHFMIDRAAKEAMLGETQIREGDAVSIDGRKGEVFASTRPIVVHAERPSFQQLMRWAKQMQGVEIRANADLPGSVERALAFGASGIGLCRTEHMFFGAPLRLLQASILAVTPEMRKGFLDRLLPIQRQAFEGIFKAAKKLPVTIRLMDPPLHEFLPAIPKGTDIIKKMDDLGAMFSLGIDAVEQSFASALGEYVPIDPNRFYVELHQDSPELAALAEQMNFPSWYVRKLIRELWQKNPMMGLRGVRLGLEHPEFYEMQVRAIFEAAVAVNRQASTPVNGRTKHKVEPKILLPMINEAGEVSDMREIIDRVKEQVEKETRSRIRYQLGAMIETPTGALNAASIRELCEFFSFGTNDLTQCSFGLSREDARPILETYRKRRIRSVSPFEELDDTVAKLIALTVGTVNGPDWIVDAAEAGKVVMHGTEKTAPRMPSGICGEQGVNPKTIRIARETGVDYVSVSPYRVSAAIIASAQDNISTNAHADSLRRTGVRS